ncbi:MAG: hypothetical protein HKN23_14470 [Verrucomicrobiales bacterium]|nr:hypothetical protein [Verrucomicrobiales bacterium]
MTLFIFLVSSLPVFSQQATTPAAGPAGPEKPVRVFLKGGRSLDVIVTATSATEIQYKMPGLNTEAQLPFDQIESISWHPPEEWIGAMDFLNKGDLENAINLFTAVITAPPEKTKYPAPGNFKTRARRKLLDAWHARQNGKAIAEQLEKLEPEIHLLPVAERILPTVFHAWAAVAKEDWGGVLALALAEKAEGHTSSTAELAYLEGLALRAGGDEDGARLAFTRAYMFEAASNHAIAKLAVEASISGDDDPDLVPKAHFYATLFGNGTLWEDASEAAQEALKVDINEGRAALGEQEAQPASTDFNDPEKKAKRLESLEKN